MIDYFLNHKTYFVFSIFILILICIDKNVQHTSETRMCLIKKNVCLYDLIYMKIIHTYFF